MATRQLGWHQGGLQPLIFEISFAAYVKINSWTDSRNVKLGDDRIRTSDSKNKTHLAHSTPFTSCIHEYFSFILVQFLQIVNFVWKRQ